MRLLAAVAPAAQLLPLLFSLGHTVTSWAADRRWCTSGLCSVGEGARRFAGAHPPGLECRYTSDHVEDARGRRAPRPPACATATGAIARSVVSPRPLRRARDNGRFRGERAQRGPCAAVARGARRARQRPCWRRGCCAHRLPHARPFSLVLLQRVASAGAGARAHHKGHLPVDGRMRAPRRGRGLARLLSLRPSTCRGLVASAIASAPVSSIASELARSKHARQPQPHRTAAHTTRV